jgi:hypothetical protein
MVAQAPFQGSAVRRLSCLVVACGATFFSISPAAGAGPRVAELEFQRLHPCPANGARDGDCPGYAIDHVVPLCLGGPDVVYNMRWQRLAELKRSDSAETRECRSHRQEPDSPVAEAPSTRT